MEKGRLCKIRLWEESEGGWMDTVCVDGLRLWEEIEGDRLSGWCVTVVGEWNRSDWKLLCVCLGLWKESGRGRLDIDVWVK